MLMQFDPGMEYRPDWGSNKPPIAQHGAAHRGMTRPPPQGASSLPPPIIPGLSGNTNIPKKNPVGQNVPAQANKDDKS